MAHLSSNEIFWLFVFFIVLMAIASLYSLFAAFRPRSPAELQAERDERERKLNEGWRIPLITIGNGGDAGMATKLTGLLVGPLIIVFLVGFMFEVADQEGTSYLPGILMISPILAGLLLIGLRAFIAKRRRAGWIAVRARCTDRDIRKTFVGDPSTSRQRGWQCRIVCEFDHAGQNHRITPNVRWKFLLNREADFPLKPDVEEFLDSKISPEGHCQLRVNPKNPLQGELC